MAQFDVYPNPGQNKIDIPYLVAIQNNHIVTHTGTSVVIPLRTNSITLETICPPVEISGIGSFVLSTIEIFAIASHRLRAPVGTLSLTDRTKIRPAIDKVIGEY
jgi:hypothetical protein